MKWAVTVVSPPSYPHSQAFNEVAETILNGLKAIGYDAILTDEGAIEGRQHIILGSNLLWAYPIRISENAIIYNLEQIENNQTWNTPTLMDVFKKHIVWDYCESNVTALSKYGIQVAHVLPIGYRKELTRIQKSPQQDIDVLFIGSTNERRQAVLESMRVFGLKASYAFGVYGAQRDELITRSKILLNVHYYEAKILEIVRISYYLANRCVVLSESSANPSEDDSFKGGVFFCSYYDLARRAWDLCQNPELLKVTAERGFAIMKKRKIEPYLRSAISSLKTRGAA